ncbi:MAG: DUF971 domain-containing protein [Bacteroidota bacterium]
MRLRRFTQESRETVVLTWDDGHVGPVWLRTLRDACPCAGCQGETVLLEHHAAPRVDTSIPGRYELISATPVGNYALQFRWGDGHGEGIYTWELLRGLCECEQCRAGRNKEGRREDDP